MVDQIMSLPEGTRIFIMAPLVRGRKGEYKKELTELLKKGFQRAKVDGKFYEIPEIPPLDKKYKHDIDVVIDRIVVNNDIVSRLADSIETCLQLTNGLAVAEMADQPLAQKETTKESAYKSKNETHKRLVFQKGLLAQSRDFLFLKLSHDSFHSITLLALALSATDLALKRQ